MTQFIEIPANKKSIGKRRLVCGVGINDADYIVQPKINGKSVICPYYDRWTGIIKRAYSDKRKGKYESYLNVKVNHAWHRFSNFKSWMEFQDWVDKDIDKDILIYGNKEYGPDSCIFVSHGINNLMIEGRNSRGTGVCFRKDNGKYRADCFIGGSRKHLGCYKTEAEADYEYFKCKAKAILEAIELDEVAGNKDLKNALKRRYYIMVNKAIRLLEVGFAAPKAGE